MSTQEVMASCASTPGPAHNREEWLTRLVQRLRPYFAEKGYRLPAVVRISCGWPSGGNRGRRRSLGEAWSQKCSEDGAAETFVSPILSDPLEVAGVLVHELVHHAVGTQHGHGPIFRRCALDVGLVGPMRSTHPGSELRARLHALCEELDPYPHAALNAGAAEVRKQSTRMLKIQCAQCGCLGRMVRMWLISPGAPFCGCGAGRMSTNL
jgi:hypothetical protein